LTIVKEMLSRYLEKWREQLGIEWKEARIVFGPA
jgi:hypothetical protein